ncbi:hypothetical protein SADUNF_Sadunf18G0108400 [Salix dunnii]|uniref:BHLH domain-containing protein n=1 Tax=Salix dunnii TaxID=1413687 RepID=A0A835MGP5_9ROSI|nr:hypothetical protein SADUNF_Sadunf18G0108400 [Salix dunnii]
MSNRRTISLKPCVGILKSKNNSIHELQPHSQSMETFDYQTYWEMANMSWNDELNSWEMDQASSQIYDSSSPDGAASALASRNTVSERNRRKKLNDKLFALREAVPKISKLDKASIIKDAIDYIQDLQQQETRLQAEIRELESERLENDKGYEFERDLPVLLTSKKIPDPRSDPIEVHQLRVTSMGEKTLFVSLTCSQARGAMTRICEVFESLKVKIITASVTTVSGMVKTTILIEADLEEIDHLRLKIERAISALNWETNQQFTVGNSDSSSPDENTQTIASKNIVSERSRRQKLSDKLLALREAVPKISKLDKASVIKDAIDYIQDLQEQERRLQADIRELESRRLEKNHTPDIEDELPVLLRSKRTKYDQVYDHWLARSTCPIQVHELSVTSMREKTLSVSLTCSKTTDAMIRICEVFESLKLKIITANITALSGMVKKTVLIEVDEEEKENLKTKIERACSKISTNFLMRSHDAKKELSTIHTCPEKFQRETGGRKLNDKLFALREAVPKISKLDKASIIKDAIDYIQDLQQQETRLQAEIRELESERLENDKGYEFERDLPVLLTSKKIPDPRSHPIEVHQLRVTSMGEKTLFVSLTCSQAREAMARICEVFESLKVMIITASVTTVSGMVKTTILIEADLEEIDYLRLKIERAISALSGPYNPQSILACFDKNYRLSIPHNSGMVVQARLTLLLSFEFSFCPSTQPHISMDIIDNHLEYQNYWETNLFWNEALDYSWETNQQFSVGNSDSSSPDENNQPIASKNIVSERRRRQKLSDKLLALREAVPKISKLDKASVIKDAIDYIQDLQEQERRLQADIRELESRRLEKNHTPYIEDELPVLLRSKRTKYEHVYDHWLARSTCPIQVHELSVTSMGEKTLFVSLTCSTTTDAMIRICDVFESLKLKIITANITTLSGMVKKTVLIEVDEEEKEHLKTKIERAVSALRSAYNPIMGI